MSHSHAAVTPRRRSMPRLRKGSRARRWSRDAFAAGTMLVAFAMVAVGSLAPPASDAVTESDALTSAAASATVGGHTQTLVAANSTALVVSRDSYTATAGVQSLAAAGTNYDWAKLVLLDAGFPQSETNITVMTRWMRQENGPDNWWNRNNPLNNGWGSGGNSGLNSYPSLEVAAENAAEALLSFPGYRQIVAGLSTSAPSEVTEAAIWASPWASSHYANGGHWAYTPVPAIDAPGGTWAN